MPQRNLYNSVYEAITGTNLEFDFEEATERKTNNGVVTNHIDKELTQYRWDVAKTKAMIKFLEGEKKFYSKLISLPIAIGKMSLTEFYETTSAESTDNHYFRADEKYHKASWKKRRECAIRSWSLWKDVKIGDLTNYYGEQITWNVRQNSHKEKLKEEYEYMTTGKGYNYYLNELAIERSLKIHEQVFGEAIVYEDVVRKNERKVRAQRETLVHDIRKLADGVQDVYNNLQRRWTNTTPHYKGDATKIISSMRSVNKKIKDLEQDLIYFKEAFRSEWGENTVIANFDNEVGDISEKNPYLEKRILWESLLEPSRRTYDEICAKLVSLNQHLEDLGTEEELIAQQDERDKLFREKHERRKVLERNKEDRSFIARDREELRKAKHQEMLIKATGLGHGHLRSDGEEKRLHTSLKEAYKLLNKLYSKDGRMLEVYKKEISIRYTQWCKSTRRSVHKYITFDGWFLRSFQE
jgi:hypothetical protein